MLSAGCEIREDDIADDRITTDPEQWRALMALSDDGLLHAWKEARSACKEAWSQGNDLSNAEQWQTLIEGAAASRFGVGRHLERYWTKYSAAIPE